MTRRFQIGVMGPSTSSYPKDQSLVNRIENFSEQIGVLLAKKDVLVLTGGCSGVMDYAMRGAKKQGGITIGFPGIKRASSNQYTDVEVLLDVDIGSFALSGMLSCDSIITIPARSAGTLAEVCLAYRHAIPNVILRGFDKMYDEYLIDKYIDNSRIIKLFGANTPEESVDLALDLARKNANGN